jgi:hypothetical protein
MDLTVCTNLELIDYSELFKLLSKKFNATHDEIRYWSHRSLKYMNKCEQEDNPIYYDEDGNLSFEYGESFIIPFVCDVPIKDDRYKIPESEFFTPEYYFYVARDSHEFEPPRHLRFVYFRDLSANRNWGDFSIGEIGEKKPNLLIEASLSGLLRCYDWESDEFTLYNTSTVGDKHTKRKWAQCDEGISILNDPDSFFLLEDIITIERAMLKKDRKLCLKDMQITIEKSEPKVVSFEKKKKEVSMRDKSVLVISDISESMLGMVQRILGNSFYKQKTTRIESTNQYHHVSTIEVKNLEISPEQRKELQLHFKCTTKD